MQKISKEAKKFRDQYEIGKVQLPSIAKKLLSLQRYTSVLYSAIKIRLQDEGYYFRCAETTRGTMMVGKGIDDLYVTLPGSISPLHTIDVGGRVQYVQHDAEILARSAATQSTIQLPQGLDILNLPEESLFQYSLYADESYANSAAVWMGLRDSDYKGSEVIYYGKSLLQMKRIDAALGNVLGNLREFESDK